MRKTVTIDDELMEKAREFSGQDEASAVIHTALLAFVQREAARRLAQLGGSEPDLEPIPRRRPAKS